MCPICYIKQFFTPKSRVSNTSFDVSFENNALTAPPMGWSTWNTFKNVINQDLLFEIANIMREKGLIDAGYSYLNIDDNWISSKRDNEGRLQGDLTTFSLGMEAVIKKLNAYGVKVGLYTSNGTHTCEDLPSSLGREEIDAKTFAKWGAEYFKYDFCHNIPISKYAPLIYGISICKKGESAESVYGAKNTFLSGNAKFMPCKKLPEGGYVSGLDKDGGAMSFENVKAIESGEYVLTLLIKKKGNSYKKFVNAVVNGKDIYGIEITPQKHYNLTSRFQTVINLEEGNNTIRIFNPIGTRADSAMLQYRNMASLLAKSAKEVAAETGNIEKPIAFSICEWGRNKPWQWGKTAGNLWRTTPDIRPIWIWINIIYEHNVKLYKYSDIGHYNDPDMLEVGNGKLTETQNKTHFALWCMMNSPLILGNDLRKISDDVLKIVTNKNLIAINQDKLSKQAKRIKTGLYDILAKPLNGGKVAVLVYNKSIAPIKVKVDLQKLISDDYVALKDTERYTLKDVYSEATQEIGKVFSTDKLKAYQSAVYIIE